MAQSFAETAHHNTDHKKYGPNHDHIFNKKACPCEECRLIGLSDHLHSQPLGAVSGLMPCEDLIGLPSSELVGAAVAGLLGK